MKNTRFYDSSSDDSDSEEELNKLYIASSDGGEEDEPVGEPKEKSQKDDYKDLTDVRTSQYKEESVKRVDALKSCIEKIYEGIKISDFNSILIESKKLYDYYLKASKYFEDLTPKYYLRFLSTFEEYTENQWNIKSELTTKSKKALISIRATMKPRFDEFREEIDKYDGDEDVEDLFSDEANEKERKRRLKKKKTVQVKPTTFSLFDEEEELTGELCLGKLAEIVSVKFKQRRILKQTFEQLEELLSIVKKNGFSVALEIKIVISILELVDLVISDMTPMKETTWNRFLMYFNILLDYVESNPHIELKTTDQGEENLFNEGNLVVHCNIMIMAEHLATEHRKRLLGVDEFSAEFLERLSEESEVIKICQRIRLYIKGKLYCAEISIILLDMLYFKFGHLMETDLSSLIDEYCNDVFSEEVSTSVLSIRAVLYAVYHHSLHRRWNKAYQLYSFSHVAELACSKSMDAITQSLYNRALAQLGICAFLLGRFEDSYRCLADIAAHPQVGYLLGHEVSKEVAEDGTIAKVPLHMHVNVRLIEYAYLVSALFVHVPSRILGNYRKRDLYCRHFENVLNTVEKTAIRGPPEDIWEHVVEAAHFLKEGDWRKCITTIAEAPATRKLLSLVVNPEEFKNILLNKIKRECLRMFLISYSAVYMSISFNFLTEEYELPLSAVECIVGNMIVGGLIAGYVRDGFIIHSKQLKSSFLISSLLDKISDQISEK